MFGIEIPEAKYFKETIVLALPVALGQLGHMVVSLVDTVMAGNFGKDSVAAATLAGNLFFPFLLFLLGLGYGLTARVANEIGAKRKYVLPQILKESFFLNIVLGAFFSLALIGLSYNLHWFGQPDHICESAGLFLRILSLGFVPVMAFQTLKQFIEGMGHTSYATIISVISNVLNIFFIWLLAVEMGWGLPGIAWATLLARILMPVGMVLLLLSNNNFRRILYFSFLRSSGPSIWWELLKKSSPIGLQLVIEAGAFSFASIMAGWIDSSDTTAIAAHQIALVMAAFTFMGCTGISAAATVTVGQSWGANNRTDLRQYGKSALYISLVYMTFWALFFFLLRWQLPAFFISDHAVIALTASLLLVAAFFQLSDGIQVVSMGALRGMGDINVPSFLVFAGHWLIGLPLAYIIGIRMEVGVIGIWIGLSIGLTIVAGALLTRFLIRSNVRLS